MDMVGNVKVYLIRICVLILCTAYVTDAANVNWFHNIKNISRFKRQATCGKEFFQCNSGECISEERECDGKEDCKDGSDEINCNELNCNPNLFQCKYGACIEKKLTCNGVKDCRDNSDEMYPTCTPTNSNLGNCSEGQFKCVSGQCINDYLECDGKADCDDASDETVEQCNDIRCAQPMLFRCDYGACLNINVRCNGVKDCFDGSDEKDCKAVTPTERVTTPTTVEPTTPTTKEPPPLSGGCLMPNNPANGFYTVGNLNVGTYLAGDIVPIFSALITKCDRQYKPSPPQIGAYPLCMNTKWTLVPPTCARYCPPLQSSSTTKITCKFRNRKLEPCSDPVEGTIANLECEPLYEEPGIAHYPTRICKDGSWNYPVPQCLPVCGEKRPLGVTNVIGSVLSKEGDYPWQVAIYNSDKSHICGGSIINQRVVLSAAHCFTNYDGKVLPKENYVLAAGKYYRDYHEPRDQWAQYSNLTAIYVPERYKGTVTNFEADIAVLILEQAFNITQRVQPVCVDWNTDFENQQLVENNIGTVVGWGYTVLGGKPSNELKEINVPYKSFADCFDQVPKDFRKFLTHDKVCAGYLSENKSVCQGDSGGGLTFPWNQNRYFIRGVVSTSPTTKVSGIVTCDPNQYGTYTLVSKHIEFIRDLEITYHP